MLAAQSSLDPATERVATEIVDACVAVHRYFGPGLLEAVYEEALCYELAKRGLSVVRQARLPLQYDGHELATPLRIDILVEDSVIIEVKAVELMNRIYESQVVTYMKLSGKRIAFLVNFNVRMIKDGIQRIVR